MTENEILIAREKYKEKISDKKNLEKLKKELHILENDPLVKRYIELKRKCSNSNIDELNILYDSFNHVYRENTHESFYVFMGGFNKEGCSTKRNVEYYIYKNLEPGNIDVIVPFYDKEQFECSHHVIHFKNMDGINLKFYKLQQFYLHQLLCYDIENSYKLFGKLYSKTKEL